jgi:tRNA (guanine10-N2)-dimethyltransferase
MKKIFYLSKQNLELSKAEVLALTGKKHEVFDNLLIIDTDFKDYERLAYTKRIYQFLFIAYKHDLEKKMEAFDWQSVYKNNFCIRVFDTDLNPAILAKYVWHKVKSPKVDLENPETEIHIIKKGSKFFCCLLEKTLKQPFEKRRAHLRPAMHPTSLHPRLARAIVNLTEIKKGETLLEPFCGSGGILIEAGLIGCKAIGYDIDNQMLKMAEKNLKFYKIKNYKLEKRDSLKLKEKFDYIVTDLPYGLNSPSTGLKELYENFLKTLDKILDKKAVIIFPHFINFKKLLNHTKLKIENEFSFYIHKNLTRKIIVFKK